MRVLTHIYGMTSPQWKQARQEYKQAFGEDAMWTAHPSVIRDYWLETERPDRSKIMKQKIERIKSPPKRRHREKAKVVPQPPQQSVIEQAMSGVRY